ncbi:MAG: aconitate hydratase [Acidimicrobiaceae bacterium]|nr:aconitate hydratase [Acidimicrobiaceae bacterium]
MTNTMTVSSKTPLKLVSEVYATLDERIDGIREQLGRPLTLAEKILCNHLDPQVLSGCKPFPKRGSTYADLWPDRVALQDATAQMAWLQFMTAGLDRVQVPVTTHCDHLIQARTDAKRDLLAALADNDEVYDFLRGVCARYGAGFWKPGSGIIHQVVLENYAFPGGMMIGTDSHSPNAGGLAMLAVGVGGADAVDVMTGSAWNVRWPKMVGVYLSGRLSGWTAPKDVILKVADILTVSGGTGSIVEYFGPGAETISATGKATICNMGAEIGATTSLFSYDQAMERYLVSTDRADTAAAANTVAHHLRSDPEVAADPQHFYDRVVEIDLNTLTPHINGPHTPDLSRPTSELEADTKREGWPIEISSALIGSCTNSSYEDITRAASIARDAKSKGLQTRTQLFITPGSEQVRATIVRDGLMADFEALGGTVLANACGPCIGQWDRSVDEKHSPGQPNVIVTSYNRNFPKRNDGDAATLAFVASPETVMALALAGTLDFDPLNDTLTNENNEEVYLNEPVGVELPPNGFNSGADTFIAPPEDADSAAAIEIRVSPNSQRLQLLEPFEAWDGKDYFDLPIIAKAKGKCTTDHISAAGPWLRYRGHLENISDNLYLGVVNAYSPNNTSRDERCDLEQDDPHTADGQDPSPSQEDNPARQDEYDVGHGRNQLTGEIESLPAIARSYHAAGLRWAFIGDHNLGEGSSREHAAMEPRFRGCMLVVARSFARIHETNLKKQGVVALTFNDPDDYNRIGEDDRLTVLGLADLAEGKPVTVEVTTPQGTTWEFEGSHTLNDEQIEWFRAGSALNLIRRRSAQEDSEPVPSTRSSSQSPTRVTSQDVS